MAKNYTTGLIITGDASGGIRAIRATDDQLGKLNKSFDRGSKRTRNYRRGVDEASSSLSKLKNVAGPVAAAIAALGAGSFARGMIEESQQLETNLLRTQQLIETTGRTATRSAEQMHEQARALALSTLQSTEGVMAAQQTLLTFRNITGDTFDQAIEGAVDLSSAMGMDLNSAVLQLGKALEDPVKGLSALSRSGTVFTDAQKDMVEEMVETNRTAEAQAFILGELAAQYGGVAATEAQGLVGAQDTFGQKVQEAKIELAEQLNVVERSTQLYNTASNTLQYLTDNMETVTTVTMATTGAAVALAGAYGSVAVASGAATVATKVFNAALRVNPIIAAATALVAVSGALYGARNATIELGDTSARVQDWLGAAWVETGNLIQGTTSTAFSAASGFFGAFGDFAGGLMGWFTETFQALMKNLASMASKTVNNIIAYFLSLGDTFGIVAGVLRDAFRNSFSAVADLAKGFWEGLQAVFTGDLSFTAFNQALQSNLVDPMAGAAAEIGAAWQENFSRAYVGGMLEFTNQQITQFGENVSDTAFRLKHIDNESEEASKTFNQLGLDAGETGAGIVDLGDALDESSASAKASAEAAKEYSTELDAMRKRLQPGYSEAQQFAKGMSTITIAMASGKIGLQEYTRLVGLLQEELQGTGDDAADLADKVDAEADAMATLFERQLQRMDDAGKDMWRNLLEGGEVSMDSLKDIALDTLAEIAHAYTTQKITANLGVNLPGAGGSAGGMGGAGGMPSLSGITDAISGGFSGIQWGGAGGAQAYGGTGFANAATQGTGATGFMGGSMQNFSGSTGLASAGAGIAGGMAGTALGESMFDRTASSNYGATAGSLAGTYIGGPIGAAIGGAIGGAIDARFGGSNRTYLNAVTTADEDDAQSRYGGFESNTVENRQSALGMVGFSDWGTYSPHKTLGEGGLEKVIEGLIQNDALVASFAQTEEELEAMREAAQGFNVNATSSEELMKGLGERNKTVLATLQGDFGEFVQALDGGIDQIAAQAQQATASHALLTDASEHMGVQFGATGVHAYEAAADIAQLAGGVQNLDAMYGSFYQNYYTEAERTAQRTEQLTDAFQSLGFALPENEQQFRELVLAQDLSTDAGREAQVELLKLEGAFKDVAGSAGEAADASQLAAQEARMEAQIQRLQGNETAALAIERELELDGLDGSLHGLKQRIWSLQDEQEAQESATKAQEAATKAGREYARELSRMQSELDNSFRGISRWVDQQNATGGTPGVNLAEAQDQFSRQLIAAQGGDRNALNSITQYADQVLQANEAFNASGPAGQNVRNDVLSALEKLPDQLTAEEFIVNEITDKLGQVITSFDDMIKLSLADEIERAVFASQYTIGTLIDFAVGDNDLPDDLRTVLGEQAHRLDSTISYLIGTDQLDEDDRALALNVSNNLVSTVDQLIGSELGWDDKRIALNTTNTLSSTVDLALGDDVSKETRRLALLNSNTLLATIDAAQADGITDDTRALALNSINSIATDVNAVLGSNVSADAKQLAISTSNNITSTVLAILSSNSSAAAMNLALDSTNSIRAFVRAIDHRLTDEDAKALALKSANAINTTVNSIMSSRADDEAKQLALNTNNGILTYVNAALSGNASEEAKRIALRTSNTLTTTVSAIVSSGSSNDAIMLALDGTNTIRTYVQAIDHRLTDFKAADLATNGSNRHIKAFVRALDSQQTDPNAKALALSDASNRIDSYVKAIKSGHSQQEAEELALDGANRHIRSYVIALMSSHTQDQALSLATDTSNSIRTFVRALDHSRTDKDAKALALESSNYLTSTIKGVIASGMDEDAKKLALKQTNTLTTTISAALKDGSLSADERRLIDARSEQIVKTLRTGGNLNLTRDEWAVINAASGSRRLNLLADVAFGRSDLNELGDIEKNTKPLDQANYDGMKVSLGRDHNPMGLIDMAYNWGTVWGRMGAPAFRGTGGGYLASDGQQFATGGAFTNSIVKRPTRFNIGEMGEAGPEAIMPLSNIGGSLGVRFDQGSMPNLLGASDALEVMRDLLQENRRLNQRLEKIERHTGAAVQVQQAGFNEQINEQKKGNAALGTVASKARLEGARR